MRVFSVRGDILRCWIVYEAREGTLDEELDIEALFRRNFKAVYRLCYSFLGSAADAEDAAQATFMKLVERPRTFESERHERAWLIVCAKNLCRDVLKSAAYTRTMPLPEQEGPAELVSDASSGIGVDPAAAVIAQSNEVIDAVRSLPEKYRDVVFLFYYEGMKTAEIASLLGDPPSTVRNRLRDARGLLRHALGGGRP